MTKRPFASENLSRAKVLQCSILGVPVQAIRGRCTLLLQIRIELVRLASMWVVHLSPMSPTIPPTLSLVYLHSTLADEPLCVSLLIPLPFIVPQRS